MTFLSQNTYSGGISPAIDFCSVMKLVPIQGPHHIAPCSREMAEGFNLSLSAFKKLPGDLFAPSPFCRSLDTLTIDLWAALEVSGVLFLSEALCYLNIWGETSPTGNWFPFIDLFSARNRHEARLGAESWLR